MLTNMNVVWFLDKRMFLQSNWLLLGDHIMHDIYYDKNMINKSANRFVNRVIPRPPLSLFPMRGHIEIFSWGTIINRRLALIETNWVLHHFHLLLNITWGISGVQLYVNQYLLTVNVYWYSLRTFDPFFKTVIKHCNVDWRIICYT